MVTVTRLGGLAGIPLHARLDTADLGRRVGAAVDDSLCTLRAGRERYPTIRMRSSISSSSTGSESRSTSRRRHGRATTDRRRDSPGTLG